MINTVSQTFKDIVQGDGRTFRSKIIVNGTEYTEFRELKVTKKCEANDSLSFGSTASSQIDVTLADVPKSAIFNSQQLTYYIGLKIDNSLDTFDDENYYEWVQLGVFNIQDPTFSDNDLKFTAYDNMYLCEQGFFSDLTGLQKVKTIVNEQCNKLGIAYIDDIEDVSYNIDVLKGLTIREALGYLASFLGKNVVFNEDGQLQFIWYTDIDYTIDGDRFNSPLDLGDTEYIITGLKCTTKNTTTDENGFELTEDKVIEVGIGESIYFSNLYMTEERLQILLSRINGFKIRSCSLNWNMAEPILQVGDIISVKDTDDIVYSIPVMEMELNVDGGCYGTIKSKYQSNYETENAFQGSISQQVERTYAELASFKEVIADKVTAFNGKFNQVDTDILNVNNELSAVKATIEDLDVGNLKADVALLKDTQIGIADVETLLAEKSYLNEAQVNTLVASKGYITEAQINTLLLDKGYATEFYVDTNYAKKQFVEENYVGIQYANQTYATYSKVGELEADVGKINTLLAGSVTAGSTQTIVLNAQNTTIANALIKDAMIDTLSFDKISGIDINTTKLNVHSDDGKSTWIDNTIQIKDSTRTRVQIGKDNQGDYNIYIWDSNGNLMFDPLGLTEDGVNRQIIDNDSVKENAAIHGSKLDIDSVITSINGSTTTIKSSKIYFDEEAQTLDVLFNSLTDDIEANSTAINVANGNISSLITRTTNVEKDIASVQEDITTANGNITTLTNNYNSVKADVSSINTTIGEHTTSITNLQNKDSDLEKDIKNVSDKATSVEQSLIGITAKVESAESNITEINETVNSLTMRISSAELKITDDAIVSTVTNSNIYKNDLDDKVGVNEVISRINQTSEEILIQANKIKFEGLVTANENFKILEDGSIEAKNGTFNGTINAYNGTIGGWDINRNMIYTTQTGVSSHASSMRFVALQRMNGDPADIVFGSGILHDPRSESRTFEYKTYLTSEGQFVCDNIKATGGTIGGWGISNDGLSNTCIDSDGNNLKVVISSAENYITLGKLDEDSQEYNEFINITHSGLHLQSFDTSSKLVDMNISAGGYGIINGEKISYYDANTIEFNYADLNSKISFDSTANLNLYSSGKITLDSDIVYFKVAGRNRRPIRLIEGDSLGDGLLMETGGFTIIGSGESASAYYNGVGWNGQDENMAITGDNSVNIITNLQNGYDSRKRFVFSKDGNMRIDGGFYTGYKTSTTDGLAGVIAASTGNLHLNSSGGPGIYFYYANATSSTHTLQARENDFYMNKQLTATGNIISTGGSNIQLYRGSNTYGAGMWTDRTSYAAFYLYNADGWVSRMAIYPTTFNFNKQVQVGGAVVLTNANALWVKDTNGTNKQVCGISSANNLFIGSATTAGTDGDTNIYGDNYINFLANRSSASYKAGQLQLFREQSDSHRTIIRPATNSGIYLGTTTYRFNTAFFTNAITASDLKEKDIIEDFDFKVKDFIMGLEPIAYRRTGEGDTGNRIHIGLGAQTLAKHIKDLNLGNLSMVQASIIDGENERVYNGEEIDDNILSWGINYTELIPYTVLIEQDHERRIRYLEEENEQLKQILKKNNLLGEIA